MSNRAQDNIKRFIETGDDLSLLDFYFEARHNNLIFRPIDPREDAYMEVRGNLCWYVREIGLYVKGDHVDPDDHFTQFGNFDIDFIGLKTCLARRAYGLQSITIEHIENKREKDGFGHTKDVSYYRIKILGV